VVINQYLSVQRSFQAVWFQPDQGDFDKWQRSYGVRFGSVLQQHYRGAMRRASTPPVVNMLLWDQLLRTVVTRWVENTDMLWCTHCKVIHQGSLARC